MGSTDNQGFLSRRGVLSGLAGLAAGCTPRSPADGPLELTFWHGADPPPNRKVLEDLVAQFNRGRSDFQVRAVYAGLQDQQIPKILAAVIGGSPPDLLWYNATLTGQLVKNDALVPLDDFLQNEPLLTNVYPSLRAATRYRGQTWSVPFDTNNLAVFYNRRLFKEAGITRLPHSWADFSVLARHLTVDGNRDGRFERFGFRLPLGKGEWTVFNWLAYFWGAGGELFKNGRPQLASPAGIRALGFWRSLIEPPVGASLSQPEQGFDFGDFYAGRLAMLVSGPWTLGEMSLSKIDYGVFPLPVDRLPATTIGGEQLFLFRTGAERERAAWQFARYVLSDTFQTAWATRTGYLPVTLSATASPVYQDFLRRNPPMAVFVAQVKHGHNRPLEPTYAQLSDTIGQAVEQVLLRARTPEAALAAAQREAELIVRTQPGDLQS